MDGNCTLRGHIPTNPSSNCLFHRYLAENVHRIIPLLLDGSNYDKWDVSLKECLALAEGAFRYLDPGALPSWPDWNQDLASCVNKVLHRSIDPHLRTIIKEVSPYPSLRYAHLQQTFCGMPFCNRLNKLDELLSCRYNPASDSINTYVLRMLDGQRNLHRLGMNIGDDVFAGLLILGLPEEFATNTDRFEQAVRIHPQVPVDSHWVIRSLLEDEAITQSLTHTVSIAADKVP